MRPAALLLLLCTGCYGQTTYIDARFSPEQQADIQAAADLWAMPVVFGARVSEDDGDTQAIILSDSRAASWRLQKYIRPATVAITITEPLGASTVVVLADRLEAYGCPFRSVVAHEMGHMLGYEDSEESGVMYRHCGGE
jgi:cellulase/cellobiase CelA1